MDTKAHFLTLCITFLCTLHSLSVHANPSGGTVVNGSATISSNGNTLTVTNTPGTVINWQQFNIGVNEVTRFIQQSTSSSVLYRVTGSDLAQIHGNLSTNGTLVIIAPNGLLIGNNAILDAKRIVLTTGTLSNWDFLDENYVFTDIGTEPILIDGYIRSDALVVVGNNIIVNGVLDVTAGNIDLLSGYSSLTLSSVPVPTAAWLFSSGILLISGFLRRRHR